MGPLAVRWVALAVLVIAAGCGDDGGSTVDADPEGVTVVEVGDEVVVRLSENPSVGDRWEVTETPDERVARLVADDYEADQPELVGSGGTRVLTFEAVGEGTTTLVVHNCYRCDAEGNTPPEDAHEAVDETYELVVG